MIRSIEVDRQWQARHQWKHRVSTRAYHWLQRKRLLRGAPGEGFVVNTHQLRLPQLPRELRGLRIAHFSDLHVGTILRPEHLDAIVRMVNELEADVIVNTGDLIDSSNRYLSKVVEAMTRLDAPLGVYTVLGNHDHRDNPAEIVHAFHMADLPLLMNDSVRLGVNGRTLALSGIDYAQSGPNLSRLVGRTCSAINDATLHVLLSHHPHALDHAAVHGVDLVLAGHTHGGQFVLRRTRPHKARSVGLGNLAFRYPQGHYQLGNTHLFVTNGLGGSFPVRFRCPAEVSLLELQQV